MLAGLETLRATSTVPILFKLWDSAVNYRILAGLNSTKFCSAWKYRRWTLCFAPERISRRKLIFGMNRRFGALMIRVNRQILNVLRSKRRIDGANIGNHRRICINAAPTSWLHSARFNGAGNKSVRLASPIHNCRYPVIFQSFEESKAVFTWTISIVVVLWKYFVVCGVK